MQNLDLRVTDRYRLDLKLGEGTFGVVFQGTDLEIGQEVAIKLEPCGSWPKLLDYEREVYKQLAGGIGIPQVHGFEYEGAYRALIFELLGPSLEDLRLYCGGNFSLKTGLMLGDQLISRLQHIHSKGYIHGDIKPSNILMGSGRKGNIAYLTDFGSAEEFDESDLQHRLGVRGTVVFAGCRDPSRTCSARVEDLEALGFVLVYLIQGTLPWWDIRSHDAKHELELTSTKKLEVTLEELCEGLPREFQKYFHHIRTLRGGQKPRYSYLRSLFQRAFIRRGFTYDFVFDWTILKFIASKGG